MAWGHPKPSGRPGTLRFTPRDLASDPVTPGTGRGGSRAVRVHARWSRPVTTRRSNPRAINQDPAATTPSRRPKSSRTPSAGPAPEEPAEKSYVLDTSVLLSDPAAFYRFNEHEVVLPLVV